jgi:hypothetical protein
MSKDAPYPGEEAVLLAIALDGLVFQKAYERLSSG